MNELEEVFEIEREESLPRIDPVDFVHSFQKFVSKLLDNHGINKSWITLIMASLLVFFTSAFSVEHCSDEELVPLMEDLQAWTIKVNEYFNKKK